jgi:hypothetical protein
LLPQPTTGASGEYEVHKPVVVEGVQKGCHVQGVVRRCSDPMCGAVQIQDGAEQVNLVETVRALRARRIRPPPPPPPPPPPHHPHHHHHPPTPRAACRMAVVGRSTGNYLRVGTLVVLLKFTNPPRAIG